jgi:UDP-N-acetylmuramyl pentapeptide phosphotransferase/UDP-N-acetylglucosamine-1-phosphate transferase
LSPSTLTLVLVVAGSFACSAIASRLALAWLAQRNVLDRPNDRSSHKAPVPRGGGIGFMLVVLIGFAVVSAVNGTVPVALLAGIVVITAISFADDLRPLPFWSRLLIQAVAVGAVLWSMPADSPILAGFLPVWLDRIIVGLAWLWFINLFNFMDGIDGIAAGEAVVIGIGLVGLALFQSAFVDGAIPAAIVAAAAAGFLIYNWHPARLFMGDVGSAGLGFVLGWLLIDAASAGFLAGALILPMVFVLDASTTLLARLVRGRPLATAHRDHAYQVGVDRGLGQRTVTIAVIVVGILLFDLAWVSPQSPVVTLAVAIVLAAGLAAWLRWGTRRQS